jgi:hypothetical protein
MKQNVSAKLEAPPVPLVPGAHGIAIIRGGGELRAPATLTSGLLAIADEVIE